jgi:hypothetical protein
MNKPPQAMTPARVIRITWAGLQRATPASRVRTPRRRFGLTLGASAVVRHAAPGNMMVEGPSHTLPHQGSPTTRTPRRFTTLIVGTRDSASSAEQWLTAKPIQRSLATASRQRSTLAWRLLAADYASNCARHTEHVAALHSPRAMGSVLHGPPPAARAVVSHFSPLR